MSFAKWRADDIEETRSQLNELQKRLEGYSGVKKLFKLLISSLTVSLKSRLNGLLARKAPGSTTTNNFFAKNPDFKPYQIKVQPLAANAPKQKILHVIPYFITGGSQQLVVDIIEGLSNRYTHEVALASVHAEQGYVGVTTHDCSFVREPADFEALLHRVAPDIVHVHYYGRWPHTFWHWYHAVFQGALAYGKPVVENCNIPYMPYYDERISKYVYVSAYAQDTFGIRALPNQVIYPGSNFSFFERGGTVPDPDTIGMVYRLDDDKLNESAIVPFIRAVQLRPATKVLIVGGGMFFNLFQEKVAAAGVQSQFTFTGYVAYEKLADLYRQMAVFVAPVYSESFGQVTPFAMSMAIPVAAYDIGALDEILANRAMLAPGDDADALAAVIVDLLDNPAARQQIGQFNKARATELFAVETMVHSYQLLYESLRK
jgi:glycosyltransferase involved in cell wall biosynthesis